MIDNLIKQPTSEPTPVEGAVVRQSLPTEDSAKETKSFGQMFQEASNSHETESGAVADELPKDSDTSAELVTAAQTSKVSEQVASEVGAEDLELSSEDISHVLSQIQSLSLKTDDKTLEDNAADNAMLATEATIALQQPENMSAAMQQTAAEIENEPSPELTLSNTVPTESLSAESAELISPEQQALNLDSAEVQVSTTQTIDAKISTESAEKMNVVTEDLVEEAIIQQQAITVDAEEVVAVQSATTEGNSTFRNMTSVLGGSDSSAAASNQLGQQANQAAGQQAGQNGQQQQSGGFQQLQQALVSQTREQEQQLREKSFSEILKTEKVQADAKLEGEKISAELSASDRKAQLPTSLQSITQPVRSPQWGQALGQRVVFMANAQIKEAKIMLNPEKLGPVQVKLQLDKDQQLHVSMAAQHSVTKEAMENALPRLREMLESAGIHNASLDVRDEREFDQQDQQNDQDEQNGSSLNAGAETEDENVQQISHVVSDSLVDYYA